MKNLKKLFQRLPNYGYGDAREFEGTAKHYELAKEIIENLAASSIIFNRADYLKETENSSKTPLDYIDWLSVIKKEDSFVGHMLRNYDFNAGYFDIPMDLVKLDKLAELLNTDGANNKISK